MKHCDPLWWPIAVCPWSSPADSSQTTTHWRGTRSQRCSGFIQWDSGWFPLLILLFPPAEHLGAHQAHKSRLLSAKSLLPFPREACIHTGTVSWHFLILSSVKWLNTHFSSSRMGRYIPFISVFNLTGTLKCLGSQSFSCLLSSWLMLKVPQYLSSYCAPCQILSYPILNPAFDVLLLIVQNK